MPLASSKVNRSYTASRFVLEIEGQQVGVLNSVDGGHLKAEPIGEQVGVDGTVTRYPGRQKFDDISLSVGTSMAPLFWKWIKDSLDNKYSRRSGAIVAYDFDGNERARRTFTEALISEIQFPALDAKAKQPAFLVVKISPEVITYERKDGGKIGSPGDATKQKKWVPANWQLSLENLSSEVTRHVTKIDSLTVKQNIINNPIGRELYTRREPGRVDLPTISLHVPETRSKEWVKWWDKFVAKGDHVNKNETSGSLVYLANDCKTQLMTLTFKGVGITALTFEKHDAGADNIRTLKVDLYMETLEFASGQGTTA